MNEPKNESMNDEEVQIEKADLQAVALLKEGQQFLGDNYWLFCGITFVGMLIGGAAPMGLLLGPMMGGIFLCLAEKRKNGNFDFSTLFSGFEHFMETFIATLIVIAVSVLVVLPAYGLFFACMVGSFATFGEEAPFLAVICTMFGAFLYGLVCFAVNLPFLFVYPLIVLRGMKAWPAVKTSAKGVWTNIGSVVIMVILYGIIAMVAALMCIIPVYLFMPIYFAALYMAYLKVFPQVEEKPLPA